MTRSQAAADRRVITAARALERASQYGINTAPATRDYQAARRDQAATRRAGAA